MQGFANPGRFMKLSGRLLPWSAGLTLALFLAGLPLALIFSPPDYQQGEAVRIMYVHVPAAWLALLTYTVMTAASFTHLVWRHALADLAAEAAAPMGAVFTAIALASGMLWGKPMWGAFWVWDARLTSVLVLLFIYLGIIALRQSIDDEARASRAVAILTLVGAVNIPIIKFSVDWWNTLHQGESIFRAGGPSIAASMLTPLFVMTFAFMGLFATAMMLRMQAMILRRRLKAQGARKASHAELRKAGAHA